MLYLFMQSAYLGADHRGFRLKEEIKRWLKEWEIEYRDFSEEFKQDDDYSQVAIKTAEAVAQDKTKGILICGSGVGVCMAANKVRGIRAGIGISERQVRKAREDDDVNVLCLAADYSEEEEVKKMVKSFLNTLFSSEERHIRRLKIIKEYEQS